MNKIQYAPKKQFIASTPSFLKFITTATYCGYGKIQISPSSGNLIQELLDLELINNFESKSPENFILVSKRTKLLDFVRTLIDDKGITSRDLKVTMSEGLSFMEDRLKAHSNSTECDLECNILLIHKSKTASPARYVLRMIVSNEIVSLDLLQMISTMIVRAESEVWY